MIDKRSREIISYLAVEKRNDSSYLYHIYHKKAILDKAPLTDSMKMNSRPLVAMFVYFERIINGKNTSSFKGAAVSQNFENVNIFRASEGDTATNDKVSTMIKRTNSLPAPCERVILDS
ncbi:MAG TPA: hypothetical protein VG842_00550 [Sediminibacterium sp.]|nr:hypothetical protein [Sediminibacterium sp.]